MEKLRTLFLGSPMFSKTVLESLLSLEYIDVVGVVTQSDKEVGRKKILTPTPVKEYVLANHPKIKVYSPSKFKLEYKEILSETNPELIIVAAYGKILPLEFISFPKYKSINIHGSLLPTLRGAVPVQMAILKGFKKTGVSVQIMSEKMDEGDILFSKEIDISESDTTEGLMDKLAILSSDLLKEKLMDYIEGKIIPVKQDSALASYCYLSDVRYEKAKIDWNKGASEIHNLVRAFNPDPIAYTEDLHKDIEGKVRIFETKISDISLSSEIGKLEIKNNLALVRCSSGTIQLLKLQLEGKNIISAQDLINSLKSR